MKNLPVRSSRWFLRTICALCVRANDQWLANLAKFVDVFAIRTVRTFGASCVELDGASFFYPCSFVAHSAWLADCVWGLGIHIILFDEVTVDIFCNMLTLFVCVCSDFAYSALCTDSVAVLTARYT